MGKDLLLADKEPREGCGVPSSERLIRIEELMKITSLGRTSLYRAVKLGDFPHPVKIHGRAAAWLESEVLAWFEQLKKARDAQQ